jgi:hypothetical protein
VRNLTTSELPLAVSGTIDITFQGKYKFNFKPASLFFFKVGHNELKRIFAKHFDSFLKATIISSYTGL